MQEWPAHVVFMDIRCPRCGNLALPAGHEDARAFYQCETCHRVWMTFLTAARAASAPTPRGTVLIVDDSDEMLGLISEWLRDEGYTVVTAASGMQALDAAATHEPDVVLLDVVIPPPDGFAVCEAVQQRPHPPEVILMTGVSDPIRLRRVDELGGLVLLRKPFTSDIVAHAVADAIARRAGRGTHTLNAS
jgi:CheY-like chemotaxis protein/ribosomal protein S27AE